MPNKSERGINNPSSECIFAFSRDSLSSGSIHYMTSSFRYIIDLKILRVESYLVGRTVRNESEEGGKRSGEEAFVVKLLNKKR